MGFSFAWVKTSVEIRGVRYKIVWLFSKQWDTLMKLEVEFENAYIFLLCPWLVLFHLITFSAITFYSLHFSHVGQGGLGFFLQKGKFGCSGVFIGNIYRYWKKSCIFPLHNWARKDFILILLWLLTLSDVRGFFFPWWILSWWWQNKIQCAIQSVQKVQNKSSFRGEKVRN